MSVLLYRAFVWFLAPLMLLLLLLRGLRDRSGPIDIAARFGYGRKLAGERIWLHAVSVGEVQAAQPLIKELLRRQQSVAITLTCTTPTGMQRAQALFGDTLDLRYLPLDLPTAVRRFLECVRPRYGVILETEIWPNLYMACAARGIPLFIVNARLSARSLRRMRRFPALLRATLSGDVQVAAQSAADRQRFCELGFAATAVTEIGNIKFDIEVSEDHLRAAGELRERYGSLQKFVWVAASTHDGEEEIALQAHRSLQRNGLQTQLIIAPRHPRRFDEVAAKLQQSGLHWQRWSALDAAAPSIECDVLLLDTLGQLQAHYAMADVAFVGGSLVPVGGHNLLEPVAFGVATLSGPHVFNAAEVASKLITAGAVTIITDAASLSAELQQLAIDPLSRASRGTAGLRELASSRGTVSRLLDWLAARIVSANR